MESVETTERDRLRPGLPLAFVEEIAAASAELARVVRELERLVDQAEASRPSAPAAEVREPGIAEDEASFLMVTRGSNLTVREAEVLRNLLAGQSNRQISRNMRISESTVKNHLSAIYLKLDAGCRSQVIAKFYRLMADQRTQAEPAGGPPTVA